MKKELIKIVSLICDIHESTSHRISLDTFASCDVIEVRVHFGGYDGDRQPVTLSSSDMSLLAIYSYLMDVRHEEGVAA